MTWHTKRNEVPASGSSFLPEDYLQKKAERRGLFISLFLFVVVAMGVVGAFFVTHRRWNDVKTSQERINSEYATEAKKIEELKAHEKQKADVMEKAEVTLAIKEKVPRSILMAELINRMPEHLTLTDMQLKGKRMSDKKKEAAKADKSKVASRGKSGGKNAKKAEPEPEAPKLAAAKFEFSISIVGLAGTDAEVADYVTALNGCPLLGKVDMVSSTEVEVDEVTLRKFTIEAMIRKDADARQMQPLQVPRLAPVAAATLRAADPMDPTVSAQDFESTTTSADPDAQDKE